MSLFDARFYDFNVHIPSDPQESISRLAFEAKRHGFSGIAVVSSDTPYSNTGINNIPENFSIYSAVEISCRPSKLRDEIKKYRESKDILIVKGGDEESNRAAVETPGIDILLQPAKFNHILAKIAGDNSIAIGFNIGTIIRLRGEMRIRELRTMKTNLKYARKYGLAMLLTGSPGSHYDLRSPREMAALAGVFGMTAKEAVEALSSAPLDILRRKSPDYIQEGIELL